MEQIVAQILRKPRRGARAGRAAEAAAGERQQRHPDEQDAGLQNSGHIRAALDLVDQVGGDEGDEALDDRLAHHQQQGIDGRALIFPHALYQTLVHRSFPFVRGSFKTAFQLYSFYKRKSRMKQKIQRILKTPAQSVLRGSGKGCFFRGFMVR